MGVLRSADFNWKSKAITVRDQTRTRGTKEVKQRTWAAGLAFFC